MPINDKFIQGLSELSTLAIKNGYNCPWLVEGLRWSMQQGQNQSTGIVGTASTTARTPANATLNNAIVTALGTFPNGVNAASLRQVLKAQGITMVRPGPTLAALNRSGLIHKTGQLWFAGQGSKVSRRLTRRATGQKRTRRQAATGNSQQQAQAA